MSFEAFLWAANDAPVADVNEFAVLIQLAERADPDGCNAFPSVATVAERTRIHPRTVKRCLQCLEDRGLIARGDQRAAEYIRADRRPTVYDLLIPYEWFSNVDRINADRARRNMPPLTPAMRPNVPPAPEKKRRADAGQKRPKTERGDFESPRDEAPDGVTTSHGVTDSPERGDLQSATGCLVVTRTCPENQPQEPVNHAGSSSGALFDVAEDDVPTADAAGGDEQQTEKVTAQTIVGEWLERCAKRPPQRITGQVAKVVKELLDERIDPDDVRRGMGAWMRSGKTAPSLIPGFVHEVMNAPAMTGVLATGGHAAQPAQFDRRPSTTDQRVRDALEAGRRLQARADAMREQGASL